MTRAGEEDAGRGDHPMIAVIGCGNPNRSDDAVGSEVVRALKSTPIFSDTRIRLLDGGTDGMGVMFAARGCRRLIVIDACRSGSPAGAIFEVPARSWKRRISLHSRCTISAGTMRSMPVGEYSAKIFPVTSPSS